MKKFVVFSFVWLVIVSFGLTAYGQDKLEFKASGFIDAITHWGVNAHGVPDTTSGEYDKEQAWLTSRLRLRFDAIMGKNLKGVIYLEADSGRWGENGSGRNNYGNWGGDQAAVEVKNVYVDFGVPLIPVQTTMRVGLQPLGIRGNLLMTSDGMGVTMGVKVDPVLVNVQWGKPDEGADAASDDNDFYLLEVRAKVSTLTIGGYGLYWNANSYPLNAVTPTYNAAPSYSAEAWWAGLYTDGKLGPVNLNFDFIYTDYKADPRGVYPYLTKEKGDGWLARVKVDFPWEKFNFGIVGLYATGDDARKASNRGRYDSYVVPPGSEQAGAFGESGIFYSTWMNRGNTGISAPPGGFINGNQIQRGGAGGTWFIKPYVSAKVMPTYKVTFQALVIGDNTDKGNTIGTARKADLVTLRDDSMVGYEFDLINEIQIYKNLKYTIFGGILVADDALDAWDSNTSTNDSPKNPWAISTNLTYTF